MERGAEEVELVKGVAGVFEITVDGRLAFSKKQLGRFPEDAEIDAVLAGGPDNPLASMNGGAISAVMSLQACFETVEHLDNPFDVGVPVVKAV